MKRLPTLLVLVVFGLGVGVVLYDTVTYPSEVTELRQKNIQLKQQLQDSQHFLELSEGRYQALCNKVPTECLTIE